MASWKHLLFLAIFIAACSSDKPMVMTTKSVTALGDSITDGIGDPALNSYCLELNALLGVARPDVTLNWIGPITNGDAPTNHRFGAVGATTTQFAPSLAASFGPGKTYDPNFYIVLIGTNDCLTALGTTNFPVNYAALLNQIHTASPAAGIVVSFITDQSDPVFQARIDTCNAALPGLWTTATAGGIILERAAPRLYQPLHFSAGAHPNPSGYSRMAYGFLEPTLRMLNLI